MMFAYGKSTARCLLGISLSAAILVGAGLAGCSQSDVKPAATQTARHASRTWFRRSKASVRPADVEQLRRNLRRVVAQSRDQVFPALVNIYVVTVDYWGGKEHKSRAVGSGTIISKDGYVLTNQHVTNDGKKFRCTLANEEEVPAELVGEDPLTDLAVLKLDLAARKDKSPLPVAHFGDSDNLEIGDYVMAMGSPFALSRSVTLGIVSNTRRVFAGGQSVEEMELEDGQRTGLFTQWIQHDAAINPGNSGGPLVNLAGQIVGVNELGGGGGLGFAIPSNLAQKVADALIKHGTVRRSWIGVAFKPIEKTGIEKGVLVNSVVKGEPAYKAGIRAGDVIVAVGKTPVTVRFPEEVPPLMKTIADLPVGSKIDIRYDRDGKSHETVVTTELLKKDRGRQMAFRLWGLTGMEITEKTAFDRHLDSTDGVMVSGVRDGSPSSLAEPGLFGGDVIVAIDDKPIRNLDDLVAAYDKLMGGEKAPKYVLVQFDRSGKNYATLIKPRQDDDDDPPREVAKAWIGIDTQPVLKELAEKLGEPKAVGFRVTRIYPRTLAAHSDLKVGDIVTSLNGERLRPRGMQDAGLFTRRVHRLRIGNSAHLGVIREHEPLDVTVELERTRLTADEVPHDEDKDFEMAVRDITFFDRDENCWTPDVEGVIVSQVEGAGWAGLGGIHVGDLIQRIGSYEIKDVQGFRKAMKKITKTQPERVVFVVLRDQRTNFQYVEPDWKPVTGSEMVGVGHKTKTSQVKAKE